MCYEYSWHCQFLTIRYRVITRLDRKVKEYGSWNQLKTTLRQQEIRSELGSLQTDMENIIANISISQNAVSSFAHRSNLVIHGGPFTVVEGRKRTTRASLTALEEAFVSNPQPNASLRKELAKTLDMPERSVQVCEIMLFLEKHRH